MQMPQEKRIRFVPFITDRLLESCRVDLPDGRTEIRIDEPAEVRATWSFFNSFCFP